MGYLCTIHLSRTRFAIIPPLFICHGAPHTYDDDDYYYYINSEIFDINAEIQHSQLFLTHFMSTTFLWKFLAWCSSVNYLASFSFENMLTTYMEYYPKGHRFSVSNNLFTYFLLFAFFRWIHWNPLTVNRLIISFHFIYLFPA